MSYFDDVIEPRLYRDPPYLPKEHTATDGSSAPYQTKDGRKMTVGEMTDNHLKNAHAMIGGRIGTSKERKIDVKYYAYLRAEMNRRSNPATL